MLETVHLPMYGDPYSVLKDLVRHFVFQFRAGAVEKCYKQHLSLYFVWAMFKCLNPLDLHYFLERLFHSLIDLSAM